MSTNLIPAVSAESFGALVPGSYLQEALQANLMPGEGFDLSLFLSVKNPTGGQLKWSIDDALVESVTGLMVGYTCSGVLWGSDNPAPGTRPVLVTHDMRTARVTTDEIPSHLAADIDAARNPDGTVRWADLPQNQWGSGKGGIGKLAKEQRRIFVLRENDVFPLVFTIQPGGLKNVRSKVARFPVPHYAAVVKLWLVPATSRTRKDGSGGVPYAKVDLAMVGRIDPEQARAVKSIYTDRIAASVGRMDVRADESHGDDDEALD